MSRAVETVSLRHRLATVPRPSSAGEPSICGGDGGSRVFITDLHHQPSPQLSLIARRRRHELVPAAPAQHDRTAPRRLQACLHACLPALSLFIPARLSVSHVVCPATCGLRPSPCIVPPPCHRHGAALPSSFARPSRHTSGPPRIERPAPNATASPTFATAAIESPRITPVAGGDNSCFVLILSTNFDLFSPVAAAIAAFVSDLQTHARLFTAQPSGTAAARAELGEYLVRHAPLHAGAPITASAGPPCLSSPANSPSRASAVLFHQAFPLLSLSPATTSILHHHDHYPHPFAAHRKLIASALLRLQRRRQAVATGLRVQITLLCALSPQPGDHRNF
ncbi:hypothetical protein ANO11243_014450 [Dothideomycetidae sp. 11243]|nr:hypothetical protein ANO11243_014450 [fungal sp. No.11243]